jgi:hypothetical protein
MLSVFVVVFLCYFVSLVLVAIDKSFLSSDLLGGRETGSRGFRLAAEYSASLFSMWGFEPAGDPDSGAGGQKLISGWRFSTSLATVSGKTQSGSGRLNNN